MRFNSGGSVVVYAAAQSLKQNSGFVPIVGTVVENDGNVNIAVFVRIPVYIRPEKNDFFRVQSFADGVCVSSGDLPNSCFIQHTNSSVSS